MATTIHHASVFLGADSLYYWNVKANNREIISSGEGYHRRSAAMNGIRTAHPEFARSQFEYDGSEWVASVQVPTLEESNG